MDNWLVEIGKIIPNMMENYWKYAVLNNVKKGKLTFKQFIDEDNCSNSENKNINNPSTNNTFKRLSSNVNFKKNTGLSFK